MADTPARPAVGDEAPDFTLPSYPAGEVTLSQFRGKPVVLYFYPKDDTPGCTTQACGFRDQHPAFEKAGAVVLGISPDTVESHEKFAGKFGLPFTLLADVGHHIADRYGVWVEKNMYGKKSMGIQRATFLIGPDGRVAAVWPRVRVEGHVDKVAEKIAELQGA